MDLLTNITVVDDAIRFVSQQSNEDLKSLHNSDEDEKETNDPCDDEDHLKEKEEQQASQLVSTRNAVF
jgi:hypothetical protein